MTITRKGPRHFGFGLPRGDRRPLDSVRLVDFSENELRSAYHLLVTLAREIYREGPRVERRPGDFIEAPWVDVDDWRAALAEKGLTDTAKATAIFRALQQQRRVLFNARGLARPRKDDGHLR